MEEAEAFVDGLPWRKVAGTPEGPLHKPPDAHQYVIATWPQVDEVQFGRFVKLVRARGVKGGYVPPYSGRPQVNLYLQLSDGFTYWHIPPRQLCRTRTEDRQYELIPEQTSLQFDPDERSTDE